MVNPSNPYDFITNPVNQPKKSLLPTGKVGRLIIVGVGLVLLLMLFIIVVSLLGSSDKALKADYAELTQQQTEIIRVSTLGSSSARESSTKNIAINSKLTVSSQQNEILPLAKKAGAPTDTKSLALGSNSKTDQTLESAEQSNQFDQAFSKVLLESLQVYQKQLKKLHDASENQSTKAILSKAFNSVNDLLKSLPSE